jgi:putative sigma-54 modulation protein
MVPIQYSGQNIEISPTIRDYANKKFSRLEKHSHRITSMHVIFSVNKARSLQMAEAKLHIPGSEIYAEAESEDMYKTIDLLLDRLVRQLEKHKGKHEGSH